jgi:hypothetical protein
MRIHIQNWKFLGVVLSAGMLLPLVPIQRANADITNVTPPPLNSNVAPPIVSNVRDLPQAVKDFLSNLVESGLFTREELQKLLKSPGFLAALSRRLGFQFLQQQAEQLARIQQSNPDVFNDIKDRVISSYSNIGNPTNVNPSNILNPSDLEDDDDDDAPSELNSSPTVVPNNPDADDSN